MAPHKHKTGNFVIKGDNTYIAAVNEQAEAVKLGKDWLAAVMALDKTLASLALNLDKINAWFNHVAACNAPASGTDAHNAYTVVIEVKSRLGGNLNGHIQLATDLRGSLVSLLSHSPQILNAAHGQAPSRDSQSSTAGNASGVTGSNIKPKHSPPLSAAREAVSEIFKMQVLVRELQIFHNQNQPENPLCHLAGKQALHANLRQALIDKVFRTERQKVWRSSFDSLYKALRGLCDENWRVNGTDMTAWLKTI